MIDPVGKIERKGKRKGSQNGPWRHEEDMYNGMEKWNFIFVFNVDQIIPNLEAPKFKDVIVRPAGYNS